MLTKSVPVWGFFFFFKLLTILPQVQQGHMSKLVRYEHPAGLTLRLRRPGFLRNEETNESHRKQLITAAFSST